MQGTIKKELYYIKVKRLTNNLLSKPFICLQIGDFRIKTGCNQNVHTIVYNGFEITFRRWCYNGEQVTVRHIASKKEVPFNRLSAGVYNTKSLKEGIMLDDTWKFKRGYNGKMHTCRILNISTNQVFINISKLNFNMYEDRWSSFDNTFLLMVGEGDDQQVLMWNDNLGHMEVIEGPLPWQYKHIIDSEV